MPHTIQKNCESCDHSENGWCEILNMPIDRDLSNQMCDSYEPYNANEQEVEVEEVN